MSLLRRSEKLVATGTSTAIKWLSPLARRIKLLHPDLHPEMRVMVGLSTLSGNRSLMSDSIPLARKKMAIGARLITGEPTPVASVQNMQIDGAEGPIAARHYIANPSANQRPLLIFFHGGGFCLGDLDTHDEACRHLCAKGDYDVLSVAYRLAPEHPFPAGINDSVAAIRWARRHCDQLGIDPNRIAVGGDSAGGTMSAAASLILRDEGDPPLAFQLLIYPATDRSQIYPSHGEFGELGLVLTKEDMDIANARYVRDPSELTDYRASPLLAESHKNLPPAIVITAGCDVLRDEGNAYAQKLIDADVQVTHRVMDGMVHGFLQMTAVSDAARRCVDEIVVMSKAAFEV